MVGLYFKNSLTAFNGKKFEEMEGKGEVNCSIASLIFEHLSEKGLESHFVQRLGPREVVARRTEVIPLEVVVRNWLAGSTAKKFGRREGEKLDRPLVEFYYKDDGLNDPFVSDEQIKVLGLVKNTDVLSVLKEKALEVNSILLDVFHKCSIHLVDFKLEYGVTPGGKVLLVDEITPDSCRLWEFETLKKLDKDRFRRDLGFVMESYQEVYKRLQSL